MTITPAHADRIAENNELRADMARCARLIEAGRIDEALAELRYAGRNHGTTHAVDRHHCNSEEQQ